MVGYTVDRKTLNRFANAARTVENDGRDLRGVQNGRRARQTATGGDTYSGYFKIVDVSVGETLTVNIYDPLEETGLIAGYVILGNTRIAVASDNFVITETSVFYIETTWTGSEYESELKVGTFIPDSSNGLDIKVSSRAIVTDGVMVVSQIIHDEHNVARWV